MQLLAVKREITELHLFFQNWFNGECPKTKDAFHRIAGVLSTTFILIPPSGSIIERDTLLENLFKEHGLYQTSKEKIKIRIDNVRVHHQSHHIIVVTYEERQTLSTTTSRKSSVTFQENGNKPNGLEWLHVHETWITNGPKIPHG